jgi:hypothetical protein
VTKTLTVLAIAAIASTGLLSAGSSSARLAVSVIVVRSCVIDARPLDKTSPSIRLTCATGAQSNIRVSGLVQNSARTARSNDLPVVTIDF